MEKLNEEFLNQYTNEWSDYFADYFENQRVSRIRLKPEYQKLEKEICKIKNKYPNVVTLLEDGENVKLNDEEEKAIIEILNLQEEINMIELKESKPLPECVERKDYNNLLEKMNKITNEYNF